VSKNAVMLSATKWSRNISNCGLSSTMTLQKSSDEFKDHSAAGCRAWAEERAGPSGPVLAIRSKRFFEGARTGRRDRCSFVRPAFSVGIRMSKNGPRVSPSLEAAPDHRRLMGEGWAPQSALIEAPASMLAPFLASAPYSDRLVEFQS